MTKVIGLVGLLFVCCSCAAIAPTQSSARQDVPVVMLSDLHFDPYQDPKKFAELRRLAVESWSKILDTPPSATQAEDFAALQASCRARGADSSWAVLSSGFKAAHAQQSKPLFVTVSGDLLAHGFDCRFRTLKPDATPQEVTEFAGKAVAFVAMELRKSFPGVPVYLALGNNDSGCTDYRESPDSAFLQNAGKSIAAAALDEGDSSHIRQQFSNLGDYAVRLPQPMSNTELIVLQDLFQSRLYEGCGGKTESDAAASQIEWLRSSLATARKEHRTVWVMAHIPPGIDVYSSFHRFVFNPAGVCQVTSPVQLLGSDALADTLTDFADIVRLAIFAHTHMDEMKLLHNEAGAAVPAKLVPSLSPVNGNAPAFLLAEIDPKTAIMKDYSIYARGTAGDAWTKEYSYAKLYGMPDYSADSVKRLTYSLAGDRTGDKQASRNYERWFYPGDMGLFAVGLHQIWPAYACAIVEQGGKAFHDCMCPAQTLPTP